MLGPVVNISGLPPEVRYGFGPNIGGAPRFRGCSIPRLVGSVGVQYRGWYAPNGAEKRPRLPDTSHDWAPNARPYYLDWRRLARLNL